MGAAGVLLGSMGVVYGGCWGSIGVCGGYVVDQHHGQRQWGSIGVICAAI